MELQQLKVFALLSQCENMSVAAEKMNTSQSQISKLLASLEAELGVSLFDRVGRGIRLNEHGRIFLRYASDALSTVEDGQKTMKSLRNKTFGTVTIGTFAFSSMLTDCVCAYLAKNPGVRFRFRASSGLGSLRINSLDMILCPASYNQYNYKADFPVWRSLLKENYYLLLSPRLRQYPPGRRSIDLRDIGDLPFVVMAHEGVAQNNDHSILSGISNILGVEPHVICEANDFPLKISFVSRGMGVAFVPGVCLPSVKQLAPDVQIFSIENFSVARSVVVARRKRASISTAANDFWDFMLEYYELPPDEQE